MEKNSKILILGSKGLLGSAVRRILLKKGYENILSPGRNKLNLLNKKELDLFLEKEKPDYIFMVAGLVGGIFYMKIRL
jgi:GDP-L-fucose synthase